MAMDASLYKILVVEDDLGLATLVAKCLEREGFVTALAANGAQAIDYLSQEQDVFMLLDYKLGDMNAGKLIEILNSRNLSVPFIVLTGHGNETVAVDMMKLGARDYVVKTVSFLDLLPIVVRQVITKLGLEKELERTQEALRKEKTHLLNNIPDLVFQVDLDGNFTSLNPAVTNILGYHCDEMPGKNIAEFLHPDEIKFVKNDHQAVINGQKILRHPIRFLHRDGSIRWLEGNIVTLYDRQKRPAGISAIYQDITQKKLAHDALNQAQERNILLADTSPSIVLELDLNYRVISYNKAAGQFFSFAENNRSSETSCTDFFSNNWHGSVNKALDAAQNGRKAQITAQMTGTDEQLHWFDIVFSPLKNSDGSVINIIATAWDVSARVKREDDIQRTLVKKERLAEEAAILQEISLAATYVDDMDSNRVIETAMTKSLEHIRSYAAFGYIVNNLDNVEPVCQSKDITDELMDRFNGLLTENKVGSVIKSLRTPKRIENTAIYDVAGYNIVVHEMFDSAVIVPLVNGGKCHGFLVFIDTSEKLEESMEFFRLIGHCAGLAIANVQVFLSTSTSLKHRMVQLENFSRLSLIATGREQVSEALEAIIESSVSFLRGEAGIVLLYNKPAGILFGVAGTGLISEDIHTLTLSESSSLAWQCLRQKQTMYCRDINDPEQPIDNGLASLTEKSLLCVPLVDNDEAIGIAVIIDQGSPFDASHTGVLEAFSRLAVQAIHHIRLTEKATELDQKLAEIRKISRTIRSSRDINSALRQVCQGAIDIIGAEMAWIGVLTKDVNQIAYRTHAGRGAEYLEQVKIPLDDTSKAIGPTASSIVTGEPAIINNMITDDRMQKLAKEQNFNSCCAVPIMSKNEPLGSLTLFHSQPGVFSDQNVTLLEEFSDLAATAIANVRLRRTLLESESLKEIILQSVTQALVLVDWTGSIVTANIAAEKLFNRKASAFKNRYYTDIFTENNPVSNLIAKWLHDRSVEQNSQGWLELSNERKLFISAEASSVVVESMPCLNLTITDLTMQKKMNASLEHAAKLTSVGHVATQIAHEIGNPLTLISSQIQRMVQDEQADIGRLRSLLGHVDRITSLIRRFSDLGRKSRLCIVPEPIEPIIDNILSLISFSKPFHRVTIEKHISPGLEPIELDRNKITQVLLNLLLNAADACQDKGRIVITANKKAVPLEINNEKTLSDFLVISIKDNGSGIEPDAYKHIFEPFYTTKQVGKGTGLGLSVSLAIIDQHQGWINVDTKAGEGSTFSVYLPMSKKACRKSTTAIKDIDYAGVRDDKRQKTDFGV